MIVYVEAVLLDNFCLDFLLAYLTLTITGQKARYFPVILSATAGCAFALVMPLVRSYSLLVKIGVLLLSSALFTMRKSARIYAINTFVYAVLSFLFSGVLCFLLGGRMGNGFIGVKLGGAVAVISVGIFLLLYAVRQIGGLVREGRHRRKFAVAELVNHDKKVRINALYDSGNLLMDRNGEGVVVTDRKRVEALGELSSYGEMKVNTASGSKVLPLVKIPEIKIYSENCENILVNVTAALSDLPEEYALILPCE